jgi:hypothetical protein
MGIAPTGVTPRLGVHSNSQRRQDAFTPKENPVYQFGINVAEQIVVTALQSGVLKLSGPATTVDGSIELAKVDAAYLKTLVEELVKA